MKIINRFFYVLLAGGIILWIAYKKWNALDVNRRCADTCLCNRVTDDVSAVNQKSMLAKAFAPNSSYIPTAPMSLPLPYLKAMDNKKKLLEIALGKIEHTGEVGEFFELFNGAVRNVSQIKFPDDCPLNEIFSHLFPHGNFKIKASEVLMDPLLFGMNPEQYADIMVLLEVPSILVHMQPALLEKIVFENFHESSITLADVALYYGVWYALCDCPSGPVSPLFNLHQWNGIVDSQNLIGKVFYVKTICFITDDKTFRMQVYKHALDSDSRELNYAALDEIAVMNSKDSIEVVLLYIKRMRAAGDFQAENEANKIIQSLKSR